MLELILQLVEMLIHLHSIVYLDFLPCHVPNDDKQTFPARKKKIFWFWWTKRCLKNWWYRKIRTLDCLFQRYECSKRTEIVRIPMIRTLCSWVSEIFFRLSQNFRRQRPEMIFPKINIQNKKILFSLTLIYTNLD